MILAPTAAFAIVPSGAHALRVTNVHGWFFCIENTTLGRMRGAAARAKTPGEQAAFTHEALIRPAIPFDIQLEIPQIRPVHGIQLDDPGRAFGEMFEGFNHSAPPNRFNCRPELGAQTQSGRPHFPFRAGFPAMQTSGSHLHSTAPHASQGSSQLQGKHPHTESKNNCAAGLI